MRILVTGGAGFIGSALVRHFIQNTAHRVVNVDCLTYAGNRSTIAGVENAELVEGDYQSDRAFRARFQQWMNGVWQDKDADLDRLLGPRQG